MHEGQILKQLVKHDQRQRQEIADEVGMSRGYLYVLYKQAQLDPVWKKRFSDIGIVIDSTNVYNPSPYPHKVLHGTPPVSANGSGKHIMKSQNIDRHSIVKEPGELYMDEIIHLSLNELLKLQEQGNDRGMGKLITQLIILRKDIENLEKDNKKLEADKAKLESDNEWLKKQLDKIK